MPILDFFCKKCDKTIELLIKNKDVEANCEVCAEKLTYKPTFSTHPAIMTGIKFSASSGGI